MADSALFDSRIPEAGAGDTSALREPDLALLRTILDSIPGRVAFVDFANRYVYVNREFLAFHGRTADQVIGRHVRDVLGETAYRQVSVYNERIRAGEVVRWEGWITYASAGRRYVQQTYTPYSPGGGAPQGNIAFGRELTDLKLAEAEIERQRSRIADSIDPRDLLEVVAADAVSVETRRTIGRAESRQQALALLLMSPEFQRR